MIRKIGERCPDQEILGLLNHTPVCTELGLSKEVADLIQERDKSTLNRLRRIDLENSQQKVDKIVEILDENCEEIRKRLSDEQFERLVGLFAQSRKHGSAANKRVAERIGLEEQGLEDFRNEVKKIMVEGMRVFGEKAREIYRNPAIPKKQTAIEKLRKQQFDEFDGEIKQHLSSNQLKKLKELQGDEFKDLPTMFTGRGRRGGGRNRDRSRKQDEKQQNDGDRCCCLPSHDDSRCVPASM